MGALAVAPPTPALPLATRIHCVSKKGPPLNSL